MAAFELCKLSGERFGECDITKWLKVCFRMILLPQALANGQWLLEQRREQWRTGMRYNSLDMEPKGS